MSEKTLILTFIAYLDALTNERGIADQTQVIN